MVEVTKWKRNQRQAQDTNGRAKDTERDTEANMLWIVKKNGKNMDNPTHTTLLQSAEREGNQFQKEITYKTCQEIKLRIASKKESDRRHKRHKCRMELIKIGIHKERCYGL